MLLDYKEIGDFNVNLGSSYYQEYGHMVDEFLKNMWYGEYI